jgi:hypothetical protein
MTAFVGFHSSLEPGINHSDIPEVTSDENIWRWIIVSFHILIMIYVYPQFSYTDLSGYIAVENVYDF